MTTTIDYIEIKNYFSMKNIEINNLSDKKEIYFLGENGDGKTILLQAITFALRGYDEPDAIKVLKQNNLFNDFNKNANFSAFSIIKNKNTSAYLFENKPGTPKKPLENIYAYGINRTTPQALNLTVSNEIYASLFTDELNLYNPQKTIAYFQTKQLFVQFLDVIKELLPDIEININPDNKSISYNEKTTTPLLLEQLSHGYRSLIIWLSDLVYRLSIKEPSINNFNDFNAIVLVDEIGMHLHPRLEYSIVGVLRKYFKNIQWFFSTHSPIVILGASEDAIIHKLYKDNGITKISDFFSIRTYANRLITGFITSPLFNLETARSAAYKKNEHDLQTGNYIYDLIHNEVKKRMKDKPLKESEIKKTINNLLDELEKQGEI